MKRILAKVLTIAAAAAALGALSVGQANAVANGQAAAPGQFPFAVKFTLTNIPEPDGSTYNSACSGSLIAPDWVITAGHCFHDVNKVRVSGPPLYLSTVNVGTNNVTDNPGVQRTVVDVEQSPVNDVAIVKLNAPVYGIAPLQLAQQAPVAGEPLVLAGWGSTTDVNPTPSDQLYYGGVKVDTVAADTTNVVGVWPQPNTSACLYDSGAPYFIPQGDKHGILVSVENNGPSCPHSDDEETARVDVLYSWIQSYID